VSVTKKKNMFYNIDSRTGWIACSRGRRTDTTSTTGRSSPFLPPILAQDLTSTFRSNTLDSLDHFSSQKKPTAHSLQEL
jgi:hypothetical protein